MGAVAEVLKAVEGVGLISLVEEYLSPPVRTLFALNTVAVGYLVGGMLQIRLRRPEGKHPFAQPFFLSSSLHEVGNRWGKGLLGVGLDFLSH